MYRRCLATLLLWTGLTMPCPAPAAEELERITLDLTGDGHRETVILSTSGGELLREFQVRVGDASYTGQFFAEDHDAPEIGVITIDRGRQQRQLMVRAGLPFSCKFHILAYAGGKLIPLLVFDSIHRSNAPRPNGDGTISVETWRGFWMQEEDYRLNPEGTALSPVPKEWYAAWSAGVAKAELALDPDGCRENRIPAGEFTRIERYDPKGERYFVRGHGGACGWIGERQMIDSMDELPWSD